MPPRISFVLGDAKMSDPWAAQVDALVQEFGIARTPNVDPIAAEIERRGLSVDLASWMGYPGEPVSPGETIAHLRDASGREVARCIGPDARAAAICALRILLKSEQE